MRKAGSLLLVVTGVVTLLVGVVGRYVDQNVLDPDRFAELVVDTLDSEGVRSEIGDVIVNELEKNGVDRGQSQRAVKRGIEVVADDPEFKRAMTAALVSANKAVLEGERDDVGIVVEDVDEPIRKSLERIDMRLGAAVPEGIDLPIATTDKADTVIDAIRTADEVSGFAALLPFLSALCLVGGVVVARDRRTAAFGAGLGVALVGVVIFAGYIAGREVAARQPADESSQDAVRDIWSAVFGGLSDIGLVLAGVGLVVALVAGVLGGRRR